MPMFEGVTPSPPADFVKNLKRLDPGLGCEFSREHSKFVITQTGKLSGRVPVAIVEGNEGGGYRYPDNRDIIMLNECDLHRKGQEIKNRIRDGEEAMLSARKKADAYAEDELRYAAREDKRWAMQQFRQAYNEGKANSSLRRINVKPKRGFTVNDHRKLGIKYNEEAHRAVPAKSS